MELCTSVFWFLATFLCSVLHFLFSFSCRWAERISFNISGSLDKCLLPGIGLVWVFACLCSVVKNVLWVYHRADSAQLSPQCCVSVIFFLFLWADTCGSLAHKRTHHRLISSKVEVAGVRTGRLSGSVANWAPAAAAAAQLSSVPRHFGDKQALVTPAPLWHHLLHPFPSLPPPPPPPWLLTFRLLAAKLRVLRVTWDSSQRAD